MATRPTLSCLALASILAVFAWGLGGSLAAAPEPVAAAAFGGRPDAPELTAAPSPERALPVVLAGAPSAVDASAPPPRRAPAPAAATALRSVRLYLRHGAFLC